MLTLVRLRIQKWFVLCSLQSILLQTWLGEIQTLGCESWVNVWSAHPDAVVKRVELKYMVRGGTSSTFVALLLHVRQKTRSQKPASRNSLLDVLALNAADLLGESNAEITIDKVFSLPGIVTKMGETDTNHWTHRTFLADDVGDNILSLEQFQSAFRGVFSGRHQGHVGLCYNSTSQQIPAMFKTLCQVLGICEGEKLTVGHIMQLPSCAMAQV